MTVVSWVQFRMHIDRSCEHRAGRVPMAENPGWKRTVSARWAVLRHISNRQARHPRRTYGRDH
ncbi:hypothetical protein B1987_24375 [Mycobacterium kansasii]|nr:hypothetical protein B1987_24375 [Mycobacterium kansasii]